METTDLSSNLLAEKMVISVLLIISLPFWFMVSDYPAIIILLLLLVSFCGFSIYVIKFVVSNICYDVDFIYIQYGKQNFKAELSKIQQIKTTPNWGSWRTQWRLMYLENGKECYAYFYSKYGFFSLKPFIKLVKAKNPDLEINYISLDVDFD